MASEVVCPTCSSKSVNTTATHPYLAVIENKEKCEEYSDNIWNKNNPKDYDQEDYCLRWVSVKDLKEGMEIAVQNRESSSLGLSTSTPDNPLRDLSPENIGQFNSNASATYCTSFKCLEASFLASEMDLENSDLGIKFICSNKNSNTSSNPSLDNLDLLRNSSLCLSSSVSKNSGATKSNRLNTELSSNTINELPFDNKAENTTLTSATIFISNQSKYLLDNALLTLSVNSSTSFSVNLDLETILCSSAILSSFDLSNLLTAIDQSISETCLKNLTSSGILIFNSAILTPEINTNEQYLNLLKDIKFEKITSINILKEQHVYDLALEGFENGPGSSKEGKALSSHNFIANDIIAHNTYLAGNVSLADNFTVDGSTFYVDASSNNVGIGTTNPENLLNVFGSNSDLTTSQVAITNSAVDAKSAGIKFITTTTGTALMFNTGRLMSTFDGTTYSTARITLQTPTGADTWTDVLTAKNGNVGIGDTTPDFGLDVVADVNSDDCFREAGTQVAGTCASDIRLKQNIHPLQNSLNKILQLKPVEFEWKEGIEKLGGENSTIRYVPGRQVGLVAQDVQKVLPHLVEERNGYLSVEYNLEMQMMLIKAIQELAQENQALKKQNQDIIARLENLEAQK